MAVSNIKASGGVNDFNLSLTGASTVAALDREYATGSYSITSSANDITLDVYAYNADGSLAGYTGTKSFTASKGFTKLVIIGGSVGDVLSFSYKKTYVTSAENNEITAGPFIVSTSPSTLPNVDDVLTINGGNFAIDVEVHFIGQDGIVRDAKSITRLSATQIQVTRPDIFSIAQSPYSVRVMNPGVPSPSGSASNVANNAVGAGSTTVWQTNSPLPAFSVNFPYSTTVVATDQDLSPITYSVVSGNFPTGISMTSGGVISGTNTDVVTEGQTFTIVIRATDLGNNFTDRSFTMSANIRPSWVTPAGDLVSPSYGAPYSNQLEASTGSLGGELTYALQSGTLFTGLSLSSSGLISGTSSGTIGTTTTFTVRVTDALGAYTDRQFNLYSDVASQQVFTTSTTWTVPANVTSVSVVAVGGGGGGSASTTAQGGFSGGGGAGGALHWRNAIAVTPGETLSIGVGAAGTGGTAAGSNNATAGGESFVKRSTTYLVQAPGGEAGKYNLNNTSLGGVPNTALGGGGGTGGRGGYGVNGLGQSPTWNWNGTTATATIAASGGAKTLTFPTNAVVTFDIAGARGGNNGGYGGRLQGTFTATAGTYQINVGGSGTSGSGSGGGWNGGGNGGNGRGDEGSGGGATDIRPSSDTSLNGRIAVAAGGGGQGGFGGGQGGHGGGTTGNNGVNGQGQGGFGGTPTSGGGGGSPNGGTSGSSGGFGQGGNGGSSSTSGGGGGGGGYYGGGGGGADLDACCTNGGGGGGGSSWASGIISNVTHTTGYNSGAGYATFTFAAATDPNTADAHPSGGGGGAAGYSGNGGDGSSNGTYVATAGAGGGGSGSTGHNSGSQTTIVGGGGVGLLGEGTSGAAPSANAGQAGNPGSGGTGKTYGAGGAGADDDSAVNAGNGGAGAVRIIWGSGRQFPATQTGDK